MEKPIDLEHMIAQMKVRSTSHGHIETNSAMVHGFIYILCTATVWFCSFIYVNCEIYDSSMSWVPLFSCLDGTDNSQIHLL